MFGLLNLHKPPGQTSRDAVNHVQRLVRPAKVGHAGTLDPLASGVLVIGVGPATRLTQFVQQMPKRYEATFQLGSRSDTDDIEGQVMQIPDPPRPSRGDIEAALPAFVGVIDQRPPSYSALKVQGERAYALARRGAPVLLPSRPVRVYGITVRQYEYPILRLSIHCGAGTYIRAIGRDLAEALGTAAVMTALVRTEIGGFRIEEAETPESLTKDNLPHRLLPPLRALDGYPVLQLDSAEVGSVRNGQFLLRAGFPTNAMVAAVDDRGELVAVLRSRGNDQLKPEVVFRPGDVGTLPK